MRSLVLSVVLICAGCSTFYTKTGKSVILSERIDNVVYTVAVDSEPHAPHYFLILRTSARGRETRVTNDEYWAKRQIPWYVAALTSVLGASAGLLLRSGGFVALGWDLAIASGAASGVMLVFNALQKPFSVWMKSESVKYLRVLPPDRPYYFALRGTGFGMSLWPDERGRLVVDTKVFGDTWRKHHREGRMCLDIFSPSAIRPDTWFIVPVPPQVITPPYLTFTATFNDSTGNCNSRLDGLEAGTIVVRVRNDGGPARNVRLKVTPLELVPGVNLPGNDSLFSIDSRTSSVIPLTVTAQHDVQTGVVRLELALLEPSFRIPVKSETIRFETRRMDPPELLIDTVTTLDRDNTVIGGNDEGIRVVVKNRGSGTAAGVRVLLNGDSLLTKAWGCDYLLGDIEPCSSKAALFRQVMPHDLPQREAIISVAVKETRGYSALIKHELKLVLVPPAVVTHSVQPIPNADIPPEGKLRRKHGYGLIIGLSQYQNFRAPPYARRDASIFSLFAGKVLGITNIDTLMDDKATGRVITSKLSDWLKEKHGFKVIFFAGHGVPDPKNPRTGDVYVVPFDGDPNLPGTLIPVRDLGDLGTNPSDTVVVILDACFSGEGRSPELSSRPLVVAPIQETRAITLAAADGIQPAREFTDARHGYFTYYVLLGLQGNADKLPYGNNDGWITTSELYEFVKQKVSETTNNAQVPVLRPEREIKIGTYR